MPSLLTLSLYVWYILRPEYASWFLMINVSVAGNKLKSLLRTLYVPIWRVAGGLLRASTETPRARHETANVNKDWSFILQIWNNRTKCGWHSVWFFSGGACSARNWWTCCLLICSTETVAIRTFFQIHTLNFSVKRQTEINSCVLIIRK